MAEYPKKIEIILEKESKEILTNFIKELQKLIDDIRKHAKEIKEIRENNR
jgi:hypothetical protein